MLYSEPRELTQAKKFIDISKLDEAEKIIKTFEEKEGHSFHDTILCRLLKCELFSERGLFEDVVKLAKQTYKESLGLGKNLLSIDILLIMALAYITLGQPDKANNIIKEGEELLKTLTQELSVECEQHERYIAFLKGWIHFLAGEIDQSIKQFEHSISFQEQKGNKQEYYLYGFRYEDSFYGIAWVFMSKGDYEQAQKFSKRGITIAEKSGCTRSKGGFLFLLAFLYHLKGDLDSSISNGEQSLKIFKDINNKFMIARVFQILGASYGMKGELIQSITFYEQSLGLFKEFNNNFIMASILNTLSMCYKMRGELDRALECIEQSMTLYLKLEILPALANSYDYLIQILIDRGDLERAQISLLELEQLKNKLNDKRVNLQYLYDKALFLKTSSRALNRGKAEEIFKQLLEEKDLIYEARSSVLLNLCDLLLADLQITNEAEVLEEIKPLITQLLDLSEKSHSYWILGETYLLQAKLALISLNLEEARKFLTQGQKITEKYGLSLLAKKISNEHDKLLKQLKIWENLKESNAPLNERIELSRLNDQMENMIHSRAEAGPELSDEEPIFILVVSEGGRPIFSQIFKKDQKFEDHLLGGFFSAINSFIGEMFSEGLDRASFGEHTLLMYQVPPFFICYVFKGQSYSAQHRVIEFIKKIQNDEPVWKTFKEFNRTNKEIQLKDVPSLDSLINEIFIDKTV
ncbi:MAG: tetratricopeptide repeat protein [Promethearchaeota archaeon]